MTQTTLREETIITKLKSQFPEYVKETKIDNNRRVTISLEGSPAGRVESSRGEITVMIVGGDNSDKPYRAKIMNGSFRNLIALPYLIRNVHVADMPIIYGSLDYWPVEADR